MIALFFDTETTGVPRADDPDFIPRLVQLGAILQDLTTGRILAEVNLIANQLPGVTIPEEASAIHGITNEMSITYGVDPKLIDYVFSRLIKMCDVIVGHNVQFDLQIVKDNLPVSSALAEYKHDFCTMINNLYIVKEPLTDKQRAYYGMKGVPPDAPYKVPKLTTTYRHYFDQDFEGAHDAMADIRATRDVLLAMIAAGWFTILPTGEIPSSGPRIVMTTDLAQLIELENAQHADS